MFTLESFQKQYETDTKDLTIRGKSFQFFVARSLESFVDSQDIFNEFPLWIKIWEASIILADHLAGLKVEPEKRFLEIGCGIGLVGIVASAFGHHVTATEYNQDALNFARANALLNQASNIEFTQMDWNNPQIQESRLGVEVAEIGMVAEGSPGVDAHAAGQPAPWPHFHADEITRLF